MSVQHHARSAPSIHEAGQASFDAIILPHLDAVTAYARRLARDRDVADEIVQDTMLRALRAFGKFRGTDPKPWLLTIARNRFFSHIRRRNRGLFYQRLQATGQWEDLDELAEPSPESLVASRDLMRTVESHIASLPCEFREVLLLREVDDLSYREISDRTHIPVGTVMSRLHRARAMLRAHLPLADFA